MVCPQNDLTIIPFSHPTCKNFLLDTVIIDFGLFQFRPTYLMLYTLGLAMFASLIAPFGGFFASGLKRTIHIKVAIESCRISQTLSRVTEVLPIEWTAN